MRGPEEALAFFDGLEPVELGTMRGTWRGTGFPSGHPLDGCLERFGWFGKRFDSGEDVFPLLFTSSTGRVVAIAPGLLPFGFALRLGLLRSRVGAASFRVALGLLATRRPSARLRRVEYRGVCTAAMVYDALPIIDAFRRVDDDRVIGAMDYRGFERPFLFRLERCRS
ncbi:DUF4334 domain-containing protein [uncultured Jannaschia sp.]|uniref:DUF4334 domain-containing protein n=1 Tax=uncultured Jannaschia sp. TaxID=293347 RepID=UPI00261412DA|nr:DUF4334 domain-containing protein [uncultured Jannaschia sp.]